MIKKFDIYDFLAANGFIDGSRKNVKITVCSNHVVISAYEQSGDHLFYRRVDTKIPRNKTEAKAFLRLVVTMLIDESSEFSFDELHAKATDDNYKMGDIGGEWTSVPGCNGLWRNEKGESVLIHSLADAIMYADLTRGVKISMGEVKEKYKQ